jgi:inosine-uridine nucleoside N-ribohydrolase
MFQIPVYRGASEALVTVYPHSDAFYHGKDGFNDVLFKVEGNAEKRVRKECAADAIRGERIMEAPNRKKLIKRKARGGVISFCKQQRCVIRI